MADHSQAHRQQATDSNLEVVTRIASTEPSITSTEDDDFVDEDNFVAKDKVKRINEPFFGWDSDDVDRIARRLAVFYGVPDSAPVFIKAARVLKLKGSSAWNERTIPGLTGHERQVLTDEKSMSFWDQPWPLQTTFFVLFVAATVQGWNQTGTTGANLGWPQDLLFNGAVPNVLDDLNKNCIPNGPNKWIFAAVNAMPYLAASVGTLFADAVNEIFLGRRNAILFSAVLIFASAIGSAYAGDWKVLLGTRAILGVGMGCKAAVVPVFAAEIAPAHLRGSLVMNWQVFDAFGIFLGYSANLIVAHTATPWRWQLATSSIPTFALLWGVVYVRWDSPRFLMKQEECIRKRHNKILEAWHGQQNATNGGTENGEETPRRRQWHLMLPDWLYVRMPAPLLKVTRPFTTRAYRSPVYDTLVLLRGEPILAAKELIFAHCQLLTEIHTYPPKDGNETQSPEETEMRTPNHVEVQGDESIPESELRVRPERDIELTLNKRSTWFQRVRHFRSKPYLVREVIAASTVMISQQLCGINVLIFYSASIFCDREKARALGPLFLCWGIGAINVICALPAYSLIETMGRKWLLLATLPLLSILMALASGSYAIDNQIVQKALVATFAYCFTAIYSFGMGPVPFTYSAEIFPLEQRVIGMSFAVSVNFLGAGILAFFVPIFEVGIILLAVFAGLNLCAFVAIWKLVRETNGAAPRDVETHMTALDLSQLFYIFRRPNLEHKVYMSQEYFGYFWKTIWAILTFRCNRISDLQDKLEPFLSYIALDQPADRAQP